MGSMVIIKRYSNRKMYNTESKAYVTLDEISYLVQTGGEIQVIDHLTGADITAATMSQVLARQEKKMGGRIPQVMLERLVQLSGLTLFSMRESMKAFLDPVAYMSSDITRRLDLLLQKNQIDASLYEEFKKLLLDPDLDPVLIRNEEDEPAASIEEVKALLNQIDDLEKELEKLEQEKK